MPLPDTQAKERIKKGALGELLKVDQLRTEMTAGRVFVKFQEADIQFPPTYKFDVGTDQYDSRYDFYFCKLVYENRKNLSGRGNSEKRRSPSWCDRILWYKNPLKEEDPDWAQCIEYKSAGELKLSDHKPVMALMRLKVSGMA